MNALSIILSIALASWLTACSDMAVMSDSLGPKPTIVDLDQNGPGFSPDRSNGL